MNGIQKMLVKIEQDQNQASRDKVQREIADELTAIRQALKEIAKALSNK